MGYAWLQNDFDPANQDRAAGRYRLLILDGYNSHGTFKFCKYAADHKIIIICLPSHTMHWHALQPCDVGAFTSCTVMEVSGNPCFSISHINPKRQCPILVLPHCPFKIPQTYDHSIGFSKTGIWPVNCHAIPLSAFEPSKITTTQAAQPLPARLPSILVRTPTQTPITTPTPSFAAAMDYDATDILPVEEPLDDNSNEPMERYHIEVPPPSPLPGTLSRQAVLESLKSE
jgi:hypothetical protein